MPVDRGTIDRQLRDIGEGERWWEHREFRDLPRILHSDETIHGIIRGKLLGARVPRLLPSASWLIVATDQRLICLKQERFGRKQVDVEMAQIAGIRHRARVRSYQVTLDTPHGRYRVRIPKAEAFRFIGALTPLLPRPAAQRAGPDLSSLAWIPGITTVASLPGMGGIVSRVAMLSPPDYAGREELARVEATVERLEGEVDRLQQQVQFLENLLQARAPESTSLLEPSDR